MTKPWSVEGHLQLGKPVAHPSVFAPRAINTSLTPRQARLAYARRQAHLSMLTLFTALLGAKTSLLEMGVQANQRYWQHLTSSNLEQLLQVRAACL